MSGWTRDRQPDVAYHDRELQRLLTRTRAHAQVNELLWFLGVPGLTDEQVDEVRRRFVQVCPPIASYQPERDGLMELFETAVDSARERAMAEAVGRG